MSKAWLPNGTWHLLLGPYAVDGEGEVSDRGLEDLQIFL